MCQVRNTIFTKLVVVATLVLFMVAQHPGVLSSAEAVKATVAVKHKPLKYFVAGHRLQVEAKVTDSQGVNLVRCYFRAAGQADYVFVGMKAGEKDTFTGILPSPAAETKGIEYLFLTVNGKNQVVKTQVFKTEQKVATDVPHWQKVSGEGQVVVSTELPQATAPQGFSDSTSTDVVDSSARFGLVAGLYSATQVAAVGGTAGAAAGATSAGTVTGSTGLSTTAVIVAASAVVVAVAGGAAAVVADAAGSNDDCSIYAGRWAGTQNGTGCYYGVGVVWYDPITITIESDCNAEFCIAGCMDNKIKGDTLSFDGVDNCGNRTITGRFTSPTSASGTYNESRGGSGTWSATKQ